MLKAWLIPPCFSSTKEIEHINLIGSQVATDIFKKKKLLVYFIQINSTKKKAGLLKINKFQMKKLLTEHYEHHNG